MASAHLAEELRRGHLKVADLLARASVLAAANDLAPAAMVVERSPVFTNVPLEETTFFFNVPATTEICVVEVPSARTVPGAAVTAGATGEG